MWNIAIITSQPPCLTDGSRAPNARRCLIYPVTDWNVNEAFWSAAALSVKQAFKLISLFVHTGKKKSSLQSDDLLVELGVTVTAGDWSITTCCAQVSINSWRGWMGDKSGGKKVADESGAFVQGKQNVKRWGTAETSGPLRRNTSGNSDRKAADWSGGDEWLHLESRAKPHLWCFSVAAVTPRSKTSLWVTIEAGMNGFRRVSACGNHPSRKKKRTQRAALIWELIANWPSETNLSWQSPPSAYIHPSVCINMSEDSHSCTYTHTALSHFF